MAGGMHGRGHARWGACMVAGMCVVVGVCVVGGMPGRGVCMAGGMHGRGHAFQGHVWWGDVHGGGACVAGEMATAADGMHPIGIHSCFTGVCQSFCPRGVSV